MAAITADDVLDLIADEAPVERKDLDPAATLESLGVASLDMISVLFALEDKFDLVVETQDVQHAKTLREFIDVVLAKAAPDPAPPPIGPGSGAAEH